VAGAITCQAAVKCDGDAVFQSIKVGQRMILVRQRLCSLAIFLKCMIFISFYFLSKRDYRENMFPHSTPILI
jgi:hypothetical protein